MGSQPYTGAIFQPQPQMQRQPSLGPRSSFSGGASVSGGGGDYGEYDDEPPLLEELGINFDHIVQKTWSVLHLLKETDPLVAGDADMAGPLVFCFAFMASLLLGGKVAFGYIYGLGLMGCLGMYLLLNLMSVSGVGLSSPPHGSTILRLDTLLFDGIRRDGDDGDSDRMVRPRRGEALRLRSRHASSTIHRHLSLLFSLRRLRPSHRLLNQGDILTSLLLPCMKEVLKEAM